MKRKAACATSDFSKSRQVIKEVVSQIFGVNSTVRVFGSRINDEVRGGDIDLLVE